MALSALPSNSPYHPLTSCFLPLRHVVLANKYHSLNILSVLLIFFPSSFHEDSHEVWFCLLLYPQCLEQGLARRNIISAQYIFVE